MNKISSKFWNLLKNNVEILTVIAVLFIITLMFFQGPLRNGFVQSSAKILYSTDALYTDNADVVKDEIGNGLLSDTLYQFYPWHKFTLDSLKNYEIPFWNPYVLGGVPFFANYQSSFFEFTRLISYFFSIPLNQFSLFSSFLELFLAGLFTFLFVRNLKVSRFGSIVSAISFMFSLPLVVWMEHPIGKVIIWLPLILLCIDKIIKARLLYLPILIFAVSFQFFAGNPEISFFVLLISFLYVIFRVLNRDYAQEYSKSKVVCILAIPFFLGGLIALVQIVPFLELLSQSEMMSVGRTGSANTNVLQAIFSGQWNTWQSSEGIKEFIKNVSVVLNPNLYGSPVINSWWRETGNYSENSMYFGFLPFLFSLIALRFSFKKKNVKFFASIGILSLLISIALPVFVLFNYLPIFNLVNLGRLRLVFVFCGAVLAGIGFDYVFQRKNIDKKKAISIGLLFALLIAFQSFVVLTLRSLMSLDLFRAQLINSYLLIFSSFAILAVYLLIVYKKGDQGKSFRFNKYLIIAFIFFDLFLYGNSYHPTIKEEYIFPNTKAVQFLSENIIDRERVTSLNFKQGELKSSLVPNSSMVFQLYDVRGFEVVKISRYQKLIENDFNQVGEYLLGGKPSDKLLDVLGVKYLIQEKGSLEDEYLSGKDYQLAYSDEHISIYENSGYLPKAFFSNHLVKASDSQEALNIFEQFDFSQEAIVEIGDEGSAVIDEYNLHATKEGSLNRNLEIQQYSPNYLEIETHTEENSFLVLNDTYYKNWQAYLDGEKIKIYPTNVAFRGVFVPAGKHNIIFKYQPHNFNILLLISILLTCLSIMFFLYVYFRHDNPRSE